MPKLKVFRWDGVFLSKHSLKGLNRLLGDAEHISQYRLYVVAPTKKAAIERLQILGQRTVYPRDLVVDAHSNSFEDMTEIGLLQNEGTVIITSLNFHFGHTIVELRREADQDPFLVPVAHARRDRDARGGYKLVRLTQEE